MDLLNPTSSSPFNSMTPSPVKSVPQSLELGDPVMVSSSLSPPELESSDCSLSMPDGEHDELGEFLLDAVQWL